MSTDRTRTQQHLEEGFTAESRNHIRSLHLADLAEAAGDHELAAVLRNMATQEDLHALQLFDLASRDGEDLLTDAPIGSAGEILKAALLFERCQAEETYPFFAQIARDEGQVDVAGWFERHAEACREQVRRLEMLERRDDR
jgi:rubrerythrin